MEQGILQLLELGRAMKIIVIQRYRSSLSAGELCTWRRVPDKQIQDKRREVLTL
jgi:hypothetical protein